MNITPIKLVIAIAAFFVGACLYSAATNHPRLYCGNVVKTFYTAEGYRESSKAFVVFHSDSLNRNIAVSVSWNTYANATPGQPICFRLMDYQLSQ